MSTVVVVGGGSNLFGKYEFPPPDQHVDPADSFLFSFLDAEIRKNIPVEWGSTEST